MEKGRGGELDERRDGVRQDVLEAGPPAVRPDRLEGGDDTRDGQVAVLGRVVGEDVEADRISEVGGVEVADVIDARAGDVVEEALGEVAVRVEEGDALAGGDVLQDQVLEEGRLAGAGLADRVEVLPAIGTAKAEGGGIAAPADPLADPCQVVIAHGREGSPPRDAPEGTGRPLRPKGERRCAGVTKGWSVQPSLSSPVALPAVGYAPARL